MKSGMIILAVVVLGAMVFQSIQINALRKELTALTAREPVDAPPERDDPHQSTRHVPDRDLAQMVIDMQIDLGEKIDEQSAALTQELRAQQSAQAEVQLALLDEYFHSEVYEARLWALTQSFILDILHPANEQVIKEQIEEQQRAYEIEEMRRNPSRAISNNLRQIASAGQQYILEEGASQVNYRTLVREGYFAEITSIVGEGYENIVVVEEGGTISTTTAEGLTVEFAY